MTRGRKQLKANQWLQEKVALSTPRNHRNYAIRFFAEWTRRRETETGFRLKDEYRSFVRALKTCIRHHNRGGGA